MPSGRREGALPVWPAGDRRRRSGRRGPLTRRILGIGALLLAACPRSGGDGAGEPAPVASQAVTVSERAPSAPVRIGDEEIFHMGDPPCRNDRGEPSGCMERVPGGRFLMGAQQADPAAPAYHAAADEDEGPPHVVEVSTFFMHRTEVGVWQFYACRRLGPCTDDHVRTDGAYYNANLHPERGQQPVNGVSWLGAATYCAWIGGRLPTEAEWEYAARSTGNSLYPWGDDPPTADLVWASLDGRREGTTQDVMQGSTSAQRVHNLIGNVAEWTADWYAPGTYARGEVKDPKGPATGTRRVIRGGSWLDRSPEDLRTTLRAALPPDQKLMEVGFRCVRDAQ